MTTHAQGCVCDHEHTCLRVRVQTNSMWVWVCVCVWPCRRVRANRERTSFKKKCKNSGVKENYHGKSGFIIFKDFFFFYVIVYFLNRFYFFFSLLIQCFNFFSPYFQSFNTWNTIFSAELMSHFSWRIFEVANHASSDTFCWHRCIWSAGEVQLSLRG